jgi:acylphosphatase
MRMSEARKKTAKKFVISGRVQGVGYRFFAERWAEQLGIAGYVKNLWDGTVEVYAIGDAVSVEEFKLRLAEGPRSARVTGVGESDEAVDKRYVYFMIEGGW